MNSIANQASEVVRHVEVGLHDRSSPESGNTRTGNHVNAVLHAATAMFQMLGVFAEFERAMIRERVMAGLHRAREEGIRLGRKPLEQVDARKVAAVRSALANKTGIRRIARELGVGVGTVIRLRDGKIASRRIAT